MSGIAKVPEPRNEPVSSYAPGTPERTRLKAALKAAASEVREIPLTIGGEHIFVNSDRHDVTMPHDHRHVLAHGHRATKEHVGRAIDSAMKAKRSWSALAWEDRAAVFLKAADLLAGPFRDRMNAACMLGQSKTAYQAEIDAACELIDFWRFNVHFYAELMQQQPFSPPGQWNRLDLRPLEGFIFAVTPFNFTSIAGNLPTAPALTGNAVVWKPATTSLLSSAVVMEILEAAGMPPGVVNMIEGASANIGEQVLSSPDLGGIHFTGSTGTFNTLWGTVGKNIGNYRQYPRLIGETGGKDFIFAHPSADVEALVTAIVRGGYEYQGQKCSAASRLYLPRSLWKQLEERLVAEIRAIKIGDVQDFSNFMGAVIDKKSFESISGYVGLARGADARIVAGGTTDPSRGWFIAPTLIEAFSPTHRLMSEEIFGPVVTLWVYDDARLEEALQHCDSHAYGLTGAIFAQDRAEIARMTARLRDAAGNFYINDKPTGAVVGQQPFGGSRASGTNDKAGSAWNLMRWVSPRAIKETFAPAKDWRYPFMQEP